MKDGWGIGERHSADPIGAWESRGKDCGKRLSAADGPHWTPTEARQREQLLKQFCRLEGRAGNSAAYLSAACWCPACKGRGLLADGLDTCERCAPPILSATSWMFFTSCLGGRHVAS